MSSGTITCKSCGQQISVITAPSVAVLRGLLAQDLFRSLNQVCPHCTAVNPWNGPDVTVQEGPAR